MKRRFVWMTALTIAALASSTMVADVKTQQRSSMKMEGFLGGIFARMAGLGGDRLSTLAVKGNRMAQMDPNNGSIVDLGEQKMYLLNIKNKEYQVLTFAELREQMEKAQKALQEQTKNMSQQDRDALNEAKQQVEYDVEAKETGQRKSVAGHDAREVVVTVTVHERGKTVEESGGYVLTSDQWLAEVPALGELMDFNQRFFKAVFEGTFTGADLRQSGMLGALIPAFTKANEKLYAEGKKFKGSAIATATTFESVRSNEQMRAAGGGQQQQSGGRGLGGALGRMMGARSSGPTTQRSKLMTLNNEFTSIENSVSAAEIAIPPGFKEKK